MNYRILHLIRGNRGVVWRNKTESLCFWVETQLAQRRMPSFSLTPFDGSLAGIEDRTSILSRSLTLKPADVTVPSRENSNFALFSQSPYTHRQSWESTLFNFWQETSVTLFSCFFYSVFFQAAPRVTEGIYIFILLSTIVWENILPFYEYDLWIICQLRKHIQPHKYLWNDDDIRILLIYETTILISS